MRNRAEFEKQVMVVDDDPHHAELTSRCLEEASLFPVTIRRMSGGEEALAALSADGVAAGAAAALPDLVLLDLRMARLDGFGVLERIKSEPGLAQVPVVILSTSASPRDVTKAYALQANGYVVKPVGLAAYREAMSRLAGFWLTCNHRVAVEVDTREQGNRHG